MNTADNSLSRRAARRFWGWGAVDTVLEAREQATVKFMVEQLGGQFAALTPPAVEDFDLPAPRIAAPPALAAMFSRAPLDRLNHAYGKSYADCARMWLRQVPRPPDWVAYPDDERA